jgi:hypothetical protein
MPRWSEEALRRLAAPAPGVRAGRAEASIRTRKSVAGVLSIPAMLSIDEGANR